MPVGEVERSAPGDRGAEGVGPVQRQHPVDLRRGPARAGVVDVGQVLPVLVDLPQPDAGAQAAEVLQRGLLDRARHVGQRPGVREGLAEREQHPAAVGETLLGRAHRALGQLGRAGGGEVLEHLEVARRPRPRLVVDRAQRPDDRAGVVGDGPTGVRDHCEVAHREVVAHPVVLAGVGDDQRALVGDDVLAQRVRERCLPLGVDLRRQPAGAREDLAALLDERDQGDRDAEGPAHHPGVPVERRVGADRAGGNHACGLL